MTPQRAALLLLLLVAGSCTTRHPALTTAAGLRLEPASFAELPDWRHGAPPDTLADALAAFRRSCGRLMLLPPEAPIGPGGFAGRASDWQVPCRAADTVGGDRARAFFQDQFRPYRLGDSTDGYEGLVTGYYLPRVIGARRREAGFEIPLYRRPPDLVASDDGKFGRQIDGAIRPYYTRAEIDAGALAGRDLELVWLANPIDAFFVSIQGSAEVMLKDGPSMRIGFAANNGQPYVAIGRILIEEGEIKAEDMSLQKLTSWLDAHPDRARSLMERNPRYIFFAEIAGEGPVGAEGVALTAGRSLAVDPAFLPLGAPVYIDTVDAEGAALRRLMLAQDSGAAIKGPLRADVYWGGGAIGEAAAGAMKSRGRFYLLLPLAVNPGGAN
jgi:membrane-bound lytic murein transglycosylase A